MPSCGKYTWLDRLSRLPSSASAQSAHRIRCFGSPTTARSSPPTKPSRSPWRSISCRASLRSKARRVTAWRGLRENPQARLRKISPIPDAVTTLALIDSWIEDYNTVHPHSRLGYRSPREYILSQPVGVRFNGVNSKERHSDVRVSARTHHVSAKIGEREVIGPVSEGLLWNLHVTGGEVTGPKVFGKIRPLSGDWLTIRRDGVATLTRGQRRCVKARSGQPRGRGGIWQTRQV